MNVRMSGGKPSYSHVVTVSGSGKIVYTAGQLARDVDGNCVGKGDMRRRWNRRSRTSTGVSRRPAPPGPTSSRPTPLSPIRRVPEVRRHPHALSRGGDPDQHDRRRYPSRRTRFHDRDRGRRRRQFLRSWSGPTPVRRPGKSLPYAGAAPPRSLCSNSGRGSSGRLGTGIERRKIFPLGKAVPLDLAVEIGDREGLGKLHPL